MTWINSQNPNVITGPKTIIKSVPNCTRHNRIYFRQSQQQTVQYQIRFCTWGSIIVELSATSVNQRACSIPGTASVTTTLVASSHIHFNFIHFKSHMQAACHNVQSNEIATSWQRYFLIGILLRNHQHLKSWTITSKIWSIISLNN